MTRTSDTHFYLLSLVRFGKFIATPKRCSLGPLIRCKWNTVCECGYTHLLNSIKWLIGYILEAKIISLGDVDKRGIIKWIIDHRRSNKIFSLYDVVLTACLLCKKKKKKNFFSCVDHFEAGRRAVKIFFSVQLHISQRYQHKTWIEQFNLS